MSGGVDSTVAAHLLLEKGYKVKGVMMLVNYDGVVCDRNLKLIDKAHDAAARAGIALEIIDMRRRFYEELIAGFKKSWQTGLTPNPCIFCNRNFKFRLPLEILNRGEYDYYATGHYAKIVEDAASGLHYAAEAEDKSKDQSYMFGSLDESVLSKIILPLSEISKSEVIKIAEKLGLPQAKAAESQDICFIDGKLSDYLRQEKVQNRPGNFVDENGRVLGPHKGMINYTLGQTRHLGIALGEKKYVKSIDPLSGDIVLSHSQSIFKKNFYICDLLTPHAKARTDLFAAALEDIENSQKAGRVTAVTRYRAAKAECEIIPRFYLNAELPPYMGFDFAAPFRPRYHAKEGLKEDKVVRFGIYKAVEIDDEFSAAAAEGKIDDRRIVYEVRCKQAVRAPAAGQACVFYQDERVIGSSLILADPQKI